jgi:glycerophosphoryl diester phosphodiesterase
MTIAPHPDSILRTPDGRTVALKVHRCFWSGEYPENSLAAIQECYRARVARAEIDLHALADGDFLVVHDLDLDRSTTGSGLVRETTRGQAERLRLRRERDGKPTDHRPPLFSEVVAAIRSEPYPTMLELDAPEAQPWPWHRVEELVRLVEPVKDRVVLNAGADWNLRRLLRVDSTLPVGFDPLFYLLWAPPDEPLEPLPGVRGAYGYLDAHPLARERLGPTADYLRDRLGALVRLVPGARELHLHLETFEQMLDDGLTDVAELFHDAGLALDVWTLDAGTPAWRERLARAVTAGADVVTTNTPHALAATSAAL